MINLEELYLDFGREYLKDTNIQIEEGFCRDIC